MLKYRRYPLWSYASAKLLYFDELFLEFKIGASKKDDQAVATAMGSKSSAV